MAVLVEEDARFANNDEVMMRDTPRTAGLGLEEQCEQSFIAMACDNPLP